MGTVEPAIVTDGNHFMGDCLMSSTWKVSASVSLSFTHTQTHTLSLGEIDDEI